MEAVALSGSDTLNLDNRVFDDLADGDCVNVDFPNDIATVKVGKNGNALFALNQSGRVGDMTIRVLRGSADDKYLNNRMTQMLADISSFVLVSGQFIKKIGDGQGNVSSDTYIAGGGVFVKQVPGKNNTDGDSDQSISLYHLRFSKVIRVIT